MQKKIKEIANVIAGYTFRGAIESDIAGDLFVLQAKNVKAGKNIIEVDGLLKTSFSAPRTNAYLQSNDVIIVTRGMGNGNLRAALFQSSVANVIASSSIHIIRMKDEMILPEYIVLLLNSDEGQGALSEIVTGAHLQTLSRKNLEDLEIPIVSLEKQKLLINLDNNIKRQNEISEQKNRIRKSIINAAFKSVATSK